MVIIIIIIIIITIKERYVFRAVTIAIEWLWILLLRYLKIMYGISSA